MLTGLRARGAEYIPADHTGYGWFRREHPQRLRLLSTILGWGDLRDDAAVRGFIRTHPFVTFRPATTSPT